MTQYEKIIDGSTSVYVKLYCKTVTVLKWNDKIWMCQVNILFGSKIEIIKFIDVLYYVIDVDLQSDLIWLNSHKITLIWNEVIKYHLVK